MFEPKFKAEKRVGNIGISGKAVPRIGGQPWRMSIASQESRTHSDGTQ